MAIFGAAIALSAFLLFWIQPLIGQLVLPVFGGTPAVWATVLVFFQGAVLVGYPYSHLNVPRLGPRRGAMVHVVVAAAALIWLAVMPIRQADLRAGDLPPAIDVLRILVAAVGLPVFVLTATTPLLSAWFASTRRRREQATEDGDPYGLYALSNAASLAALLAYPLVLGPLIGLSRQAALWALAFVAFAGLLATGAFAAIRRPPSRDPAGPPTVEAPGVTAAAAGSHDETVASIGWARRFRWLLLAAVPAGLLAAVTNF